MKKDFTPISDQDWPLEIADMLSGFAGGLNVYRTMAHHPALLKAWSELREHVVNQTSLGAERSEVVILRTGVRLGSCYEWHQHIVRARKSGLDDTRIARLGGPLDGIKGDDAILSKAVDELFSNNSLTEPTLTELRLLIGKRGILDLIATVGFYVTLGFTLNTFEVPLDDDISDELRKNPLARLDSK
ncbi:carboxymuconolactone decarboxylase family protein [Epibacterium ulvae]|uniref:carboxymuconolactone decarboxylase family protein n=1 Tax=Epibacterium ulvae TaxID=1156985 RepID=UPI002492C4A0|nr:carboxymuconolactone decarboxylase family protein [Epibacterium ulvae]